MNRAPWIWRVGLLWAAGLNAAGWVLSACGALNGMAYAAVLGLGFVGTFAWWQGERATVLGARQWPRRLGWGRWRWRQFLPQSFLILAILGLLGGLLFPPNNIDALAYRTPRVLHWLAEGRWHWIECPYQRLNVRACGFEWLTAPILALTHSDRPLFLLNLVCFLALPGLVFSVLVQAGVSRRMAWSWMWLFPTGYCFAIQAGGIGNDLYGATVSAAACAFGWRARRRRTAEDLAWSLLGIALASGGKTSNVLLILPWLTLVWSALPSIPRRPFMAGATAVLALLASFGPQAWLNWRYCGDWTGARAEYAWTVPPNWIVAATHNGGLFASQNLRPPIDPMAGKVNAWIEGALPEAWKSLLDQFAELGRHAYAVKEFPGEEHAGLGAGLTWLLFFGAALGWRRRGWRRWFTPKIPGLGETLVLFMPWVALGGFFVKSAIQTNGRILAPFYLWLLPSFLHLGGYDLLRTGCGRVVQRMIVAFSVLVVVLCPSRPLWPASTLLSALNTSAPGSGLERAATVYRVYAARAEAFEPLRRVLPMTERTIGFITGNEAETSLWKPFGTRRLRHVLKPYARVELDRLGVSWVVVDIRELELRSGTTFTTWVKAVNGEVVLRQPLQLIAARSAQEYAVVHLQPGGQGK